MSEIDETISEKNDLVDKSDDFPKTASFGMGDSKTREGDGKI